MSSQVGSLQQPSLGIPDISTSLVEGPSAPSIASSASGSLPPEAPIAPQPLQDLQQAGSRIREMARNAVDRAGGLPCLNGEELVAIIKKEPRPGIFSRGRSAYKAMERAAAACDAASKELSAVPVREFARNPISDVAYKALQNFVKAQNEFCTRIDAYNSATGKDAPALESLRQSAQFRTAEALNFAAVMQTGQAPVPKSVHEGIMHISPEMHGGGYLLDSLREQATGLFERIDVLQGRQGRMAVDDFQQEINRLRNEVEGLKGRLAVNRNEAGFQADEAVFGALEGMLSRSSERLAALAEAKPRDVAFSALKAVLRPVNQADYKAAGALITHGKDLERDVADYNQKVDYLLREVEAGTRNDRDRLKTIVEEALQTLWESKGMMEARDLANSLIEKKKLVPPALVSLLETASVYTFEQNEIYDMLDAVGENRHARAEYVAMAYDHNLDLQTVMEASLRGIPPDQLELEAGAGVLKESRPLGQGAVNSVALCTYHGSDGENKTLVFKPELGARRGLNRLAAWNLGYDDRVRTMQINVAASRSAEAIGCGEVIAKSSIGSHQGEIGLFMEVAPGKPARAFRKADKPMCRTEKGEDLDRAQALRYMRKNGTLDSVRAGLMRQCNQLEWADLLSGQVDRHPDNYLVHINPDTGAVKITGIDNDASFGSRRGDLNLVDVRGIEHFLDKVRPGLKGPFVDLADLTYDELRKMHDLLGFNQASLPPCIDRNTYNKLVTTDVPEYLRTMESCIGQKAAVFAVSRLQAAMRHAQDLAGQGKVVDDWNAPEAQDIVKSSYVENEPLRNGFYNRDLAEYFGY